jgi:uncharacterized protein (DUF952 family)
VTETIYKVFKQDEWTSFTEAGRFEGSEADRRDGFIHFSRIDQLPGTLDRYYAAEQKVAVVAFRADGFGQDLKWEKSRGGDLFPHLYAPLLAAQVASLQWVDPKAGLTAIETEIRP